MEVLDYKQRFLTIFTANVKRDGAEEFLRWLESTDFFVAPASTKYHCACPHGLVMHSLSVYDMMMEKHFVEGEDSLESFTLSALLHDLCKAQFYKISTRNVKNEQGKWEQKEFYQIEDMFPYGHGEKSVFLIERFIRLKPSEATAIRWHMGGFDEAVRGGSYAISHAYEKYPLAVKLHLSDLESTYLREKGTATK